MLLLPGLVDRMSRSWCLGNNFYSSDEDRGVKLTPLWSLYDGTSAGGERSALSPEAGFTSAIALTAGYVKSNDQRSVSFPGRKPILIKVPYPFFCSIEVITIASLDRMHVSTQHRHSIIPSQSIINQPLILAAHFLDRN